MKKYSVLWIGILVIVLACSTVLMGCTSTEADTGTETETLTATTFQVSEITNVSAQEAYSLIQEKLDDPHFTILDVRTPDEYNTGHVEGAINIDYNSGTFKDKVAELDKTNEYLVYCRSGNRSSGAVRVMEELEFTMIYHMNGGIIDWNSEGLPLAR